ncbi:sodium-dependent transporter [Campylobacter sp. MIT 12-8780]|uniref:sodium-dependent transporter n=1 Tax=unclassified Campylobacter TaxID=2593542 RepID=UPI00115E330E|nr:MULTISPECIES: sodium-dependent transporter [unclassified Campylobacter]NDJ27016.1 sodium-dependent transporter [Campylobacter sp. MIT 19-121]TQR41847.1 sodium-dependent transporter [Campylobacter sp. MIT 12-8780]
MNSKFSKIGFVLAVAGSAVGLGNAWKFPTLVGQNGGSAFILLYLFLTLCVGFVVFLAELSIGKLSEKDPVNAYKTLAPEGKKAWALAGFTMLGAILLVSFYSLVIAWIVKYALFSAVTLPSDIQSSTSYFEELVGNSPWLQLVCFTFVFLLVFYVVSKGVKNGIERLNVWMMPSLFILLVLMLFYALSKDGSFQAFEFLLKPDFSKISVASILDALGLAFFSLSLGVGTIITYSASLPDRTNFITSTLSIIFINILIGLMMGLIVFTFIFEFGADPTQQGPGLIFISLATLFAKLGVVGNILAVCFFVSLFFAGITSAISMIEPFAFYLINTFKFSRLKALVYIGVFVYILGILCILSSNQATAFTFFGNKSFFDVLDYLVQNIIMPIGGLCAAIFVGFVVKKEALQILFAPCMNSFFFELWYFFLRFIVPFIIILIAINSIYPLKQLL